MTFKNKLFLFFIFTFFSLQAQTEFNQLDEKGLKNGLWKGIYKESKRPRYEGNFEHGKEVGLFKFFDDTKAGTVIATREFKANDAVYTIFYDKDKNIVSEGAEVNKIREGEWKYYHEKSKTLMISENYLNGKLNGSRKVYFYDGKITEEANYKNGLKDGLYKKYSDKGIVLEESIYINGQYNGVAIFRDKNGNVVAKGKFVNDKKEGVWEFFEEGKLTENKNMSYPKKKGKSKK